MPNDPLTWALLSVVCKLDSILLKLFELFSCGFVGRLVTCQGFFRSRRTSNRLSLHYMYANDLSWSINRFFLQSVESGIDSKGGAASLWNFSSNLIFRAKSSHRFVKTIYYKKRLQARFSRINFLVASRESRPKFALISGQFARCTH